MGDLGYAFSGPGIGALMFVTFSVIADEPMSGFEWGMVVDEVGPELIIIDEGSTDNTKDIVASFKDDKIKYFYKDNGGPSGSRNLAIKKAEGQYIMPLDADDMMKPDFISKHLAEFEKHPDADLVYCDVLLMARYSPPTNDRPGYFGPGIIVVKKFISRFSFFIRFNSQSPEIITPILPSRKASSSRLWVSTIEKLSCNDL